MTSVAVVAHARKNLGGGLPELRRTLARQGFDSLIWHEVQKSKDAPACVEKAVASTIARGSDLCSATTLNAWNSPRATAGRTGREVAGCQRQAPFEPDVPRVRASHGDGYRGLTGPSLLRSELVR